MSWEEFDNLVGEIREVFQIPPYLSDATIRAAIQKCYSRLASLYGGDFPIDQDTEGKMLLENAAYYELYHRYEEFEPAWQGNILSWQLGREVGELS